MLFTQLGFYSLIIGFIFAVILIPIAFKDLSVSTKSINLNIFITLSLQLSLLVFIGEAVRDAFDPRKVI